MRNRPVKYGFIVLCVLLMCAGGLQPPETVQAQAGVQDIQEVELGNAMYEPLELPESVPRFNRIFKQVVNRVRPTVVFIEVGIPTKPPLPEEGPHELDEEFLRKYFRPRIQDSAGSGVFISRSGYIVTNYHVVKNAVDIEVMLNDRRRFEAKVVGGDPTTDIAVLKIDGEGEFPAIALGNSDEVDVGEWVLAIGNPFRLTSTVTAGIVSAKGRQVNIIDSQLGIESFIQTDAAINPGNSGGALVNLRGELIGINTAIATRDGVSEGYGFAVPVNLVKRVVRDLIRYGEVHRGYLGVQISQVSAAEAREYGLDHVGGVMVEGVAQNGAAEQAGLQQGDILLSVEGQAVDAPNQLQSLVAQHRPGDVLRLKVNRDGRIKHFSVTLFGRDSQAFQEWLAVDGTSQPNRSPIPEESFSLEVLDAWGLGLRNLDVQRSDIFNVQNGAYIAYVEGESPASMAGLPRDAVITAIEEHEVQTTADVKELLQKLGSEDGTVLLRVKRRDGRTGFYELQTPGANP